MPLPPANTTWPPPPLEGIGPWLATWSAWYSGDPTALRAAYQGTGVAAPADRPAQYRGGVVGAMARMWWGRPLGDLTQRQDQLHIPVASDLCQASADLLFSEPPTLTVDDTKTQARLEDLAGDGLHTQLAEAAEIAAALGGVYLRVTWDRDVEPDAPFLTSVHADAAWPEFRFGRLMAVTFWRKVAENGQTIVRHLERHELDFNRVGVVLHGLYEGTATSLGRAVPLTEQQATRGLADHVDEQGIISTESPGLAVSYVPNQRPQRKWRTHPLGVHLGRSDLDGVEALMDSLDETYSSWMRDIRLGKARVFVAESLLEGNGPGQGAAWNADREVYAPIRALPSREASGLPIEAHQFAIRVSEHRDTAQQLVEDILRTAGYSAQTFGEGAAGAVTATEVVARERRSYMTRDRKIRLWRPGAADAIEKLLAVDAAIFGSGVQAERPVVAFGDGVSESPLSLATTAEMLRRAQAASTRVLVELVHPDWPKEQVDAEVAAIDQATAVPDAGAFRPGVDDTAAAGTAQDPPAGEPPA